MCCSFSGACATHLEARVVTAWLSDRVLRHRATLPAEFHTARLDNMVQVMQLGLKLQFGDFVDVKVVTE